METSIGPRAARDGRSVHRAGFELYWKWISRHRARAGRRCVSRELKELIFRMVAENSTWGAPRIHGELKMLGFDVSERTVLRWMRKAPRNPEPAKLWKAFLNNHREAIAAMDFFTVPTLTFGVLYCFFGVSHDRRRILHCNATRHPTSAWITQQLREAFPDDSASRYLIFDRAANFNEEVVSTIKSFGIEPRRTSFRSPGQNGVAERFVGSCRRTCSITSSSSTNGISSVSSPSCTSTLLMRSRLGRALTNAWKSCFSATPMRGSSPRAFC